MIKINPWVYAIGGVLMAVVAVVAIMSGVITEGNIVDLVRAWLESE